MATPSRKTTIVRDSMIVGFALFAMFFGAGNLIFPPTLGQEGGDLWFLGFLGFLLLDAVLACFGVYVVNAEGGPRVAFRKVLGKRGSLLLNGTAILCLCVLFAMPRTAATTFELSIAPYIGEGADSFLFPFSIAFFAVVFLLAMRESRVVDIIGRFFTPTLMIGILVLIVVGIAVPLGPVEPPRVDYVFQTGVRAGYQTMDMLGVSAFSLIIMDSAVVRSYDREGKTRGLMAGASVCAVTLLGIVYGGLTYLGATSVSLGTDMTQVQLLVAIVQGLLGGPGMILLSVVVLLACVTTAVALVSSAADYFHHLFEKRISYRALLAADCIIGVVICDVGLDTIIQLADPVLGVVYPPFIVVTLLVAFSKRLKGRGIYCGAAIGAALAALALELYDNGVVTAIPLDWLPLYSVGFGWVAFAVIGGVIGWAISSSLRPSRSDCPKNR